jgi:outer membrane protein assembly complex protein YaeT
MLAGAILVVLVLLASFLHTPWARASVLRWAVSYLQGTGFRAEIDRLDYNLLTLRFELEHVVLAAEGSATPFLQLDALRLDLPWSIVRGTLAAQSLEVDHPRLTIVRAGDGSLNLPEATQPQAPEAETAPMQPVRIDRLVVSRLDVGFADETQRMSIDGRGVSVALDHVDGGVAGGRLSTSDGVTIRVGDRETTIDTLEGQLAFDGATLAIESFSLRAPEIQVRLDGTVGLLGEGQNLDARFEGRLVADRLAPWIDLEPVPQGFVLFSGTAAGALDALTTTINVSTDELAWSTLGEVSLEAQASLSGSVATVESFRADLAGGEVTGQAHILFDGSRPSTAGAQWSNLDVATLASVAPALPVEVAAGADGTLDLEWTWPRILDGRGIAAIRLRAPSAPGRRVGLDGAIDITLDQRIWGLTLNQQIARAIAVRGTATGQLEDDLAASTLQGSAAIQLDSLRDSLSRLGEAGVELDPQLAERLQGSLMADLALQGSFGAPRATGTLDGRDLWVDGTGPGTVRSGFEASSERVTFDELLVNLGPNVVSGRAQLGLEGNTLGGSLVADLPDLALLALSLPEEWTPDGSAHLEARLSGMLDNPTVEATVSSDGVRVAGQSFRTLRSNAQLANQVVTFEQFELTQNIGRLTATGRYEITSRRYQFDAAGDDFVITPLVVAGATDKEDGEAPAETMPLDTRFSLRLTGEGSIEEPEMQGFVQFSHLDWDQYRLGAARTEILVQDGVAKVQALVPSLNASVQAEITLDAPRTFTATAAILDARLSELARSSGPAGSPISGEEAAFDPAVIAGTLTLQANASSSVEDLAGATVDLDLQLLDVAVNGAPLRLARPARLRYAGGQLAAEDVELHIGGSTLLAKGALGTPTAEDGLVVDFKGTLADLLPIVHLVPGAEDLDASGAIDMSLRAAGSFQEPVVGGQLSLTGASFATGTLPAVHDVTAEAMYVDGLFELTDLRGAWQGATVTASAELPATLLGDAVPKTYLDTLPVRDPLARAQVRLSSITPEVLAPFLDQETLAQIAGRFDALVSIETEALVVEAIRGDITLERAEVELARIPLRQAQPTRLRLADGRLDVVEWNWVAAGNRISVAGNALLTGDAPELSLGVTASLDLRMLSAFVPDVATAGRASLDVRATGRVDDPLVEGQVVVEDTDIIVREPRLAITDLRGLVVLTRDRLELRDATASANGGTVQVAGEIEYPDFELTGGTLHITGRGFAFEMPAGLRTEVDADLTLTVSQEAPAITGRVTVLRGSYREPISIAGQLLTGVEVQPALPEERGPTMLDRTTLDIAVVSAENIVVDNNYGYLELGSNLRVLGTVSQPVLGGRLTVQEGGEVFLSGQTYQVVRGTVDFTSATRIEPDIDLALETRVGRYDITFEVTGTPETLEATLRSPGISQEDVISLLLTGQLADRSAPPQTEIARGQLLMLLSGELLGFAGRAIGLDSVQLSRGLGGAASDFDLLTADTDPSTRLTLAKNLSRDVELIFSQSLQDTGDITWIAIYRPLRTVEVRGTTEDDNSRAYEFRHELSLGRAAPLQTRQDSGEPRQLFRVAAVTFTGSPGFTEAELRDRIRIEPGDRFDFYRWQQDQDRLVALYHDRGFFEARVSARRQEVGAGADGTEPGLTLEYRIDRGPSTTLAVDGFTLPESVVERMRTAWAEAVFDGFLLEDLQTMAKRTLTEERYVQAEVETTVTSSPDGSTKRIELHITPGTRFDDRGIVFSGNAGLSSRELATVVSLRGLEVEAWLDSSELSAALEQYYRSLGHLAAAVIVEPPVFSGRSATLPVRVSEGDLFQIGSVEVNGVAERSEAEVRQTFGIAGTAYTPSALEPARREVELSYLRDGYNNARISVTTLVDPDRARVDIVLTVDEGRQQVLSGIDVRGATATRRGTVDRALGLEVGSPLDVTDLYRAQKRLYDTGTFQTADVSTEPIEAERDDARGVELVRAVVALEELPQYRFRYGLRLNDEVGPAEPTRQVRPALVVDLLRRNLFGRAISTGVAGQIEGDRQLARGIVSIPTLFGWPVTTGLFLTTSRENVAPEVDTSFIEDQRDITVEQRFRPRRDMRVTYGYGFTRTYVRFEPTSGLINVPVSEARLTNTYTWDTRDDPSDARQGWFHSSGLEFAPRRLGSDQRFIRYLAQFYHFSRPVGEQVVLGTGFRLGLGRAFGGQDLISRKKFTVGGGTTVRGFAEDGLVEPDFFGILVGGNGLLVFNQEVRFPIYKWVRGVGFFDAGNVFPLASDVSLTNLEAGAGAGLRIYSPFAMFRVDFGMPLTRRETEPSGRWYFGIGHAF